MRCLNYMNIIEILRLHEMKCFTQREIAGSVGCSKTTVSEILSRCRTCGLTYDDAKNLTQERINELVYPDSFGPKQVKDEPDWDYYHGLLQYMLNIGVSILKLTASTIMITGTFWV